MADSKKRGAPRLRKADRRQLEMRPYDLDSLLPEDHRARLVWAAVERLDLSALYDAIDAREGTAGQPATDPAILLALWVFATSEAIGSARHLERLCTRDHAYLWLCGGVTVNRTMLAEFRVQHGDALDALLTQLLAVLMNNGLLELRCVAHDGVRVRAHAGASSFRRRETLEDHLTAAREQVERLRNELDDDPATSTNREQAARERAAQDRKTRLEHALREMPELEALKDRRRTKAELAARAAGKTAKTSDDRSPPPSTDDSTEEPTVTTKRKVGEARVSTTDPEARVMKMGDGGWRPAYNIQLAADTASRFVVGVSVTNLGNDGGQIVPMLEQLEKRIGRTPAQYLVDGGFAKHDDIDELATRGITVFAPVPKSRTEGIDPHARHRHDSDATAAWRARMATDDAKQIYAQRAATIETVNADLRAWRGLQQLPIRGATKVRALAMLYALTFNILRLPRSLLGI
ncbi:MAG TPA: IS1182 family transposase [Nannocystaceae bacterium]|nr:IS1182 family transposase [Nannocystaceae bacterium]